MAKKLNPETNVRRWIESEYGWTTKGLLSDLKNAGYSKDQLSGISAKLDDGKTATVQAYKDFSKAGGVQSRESFLAHIGRGYVVDTADLIPADIAIKTLQRADEIGDFAEKYGLTRHYKPDGDTDIGYRFRDIAGIKSGSGKKMYNVQGLRKLVAMDDAISSGGVIDDAYLGANGKWKLKTDKKSGLLTYGAKLGKNGNTQNQTVYLNKGADGTYAPVTATSYVWDDPPKKGGFFGGGLGALVSIGLAAFGTPALAAAWGTGGAATIGSSIAAGATVGATSAALTGGDIAKGMLTGAIGGGVGASVGGGDISQGLSSVVDPSKAWSPFGGGVGDIGNQIARGAVKGVATGAVSGNPVTGAVSGAVGGASNAVLPGNDAVSSMGRGILTGVATKALTGSTGEATIGGMNAASQPTTKANFGVGSIDGFNGDVSALGARRRIADALIG